MKRLAIIWFLFGSILSAQVEYSAGVSPAQSRLPFNLDVAGYKSSQPNKTRVDFFVQVPYQSIQFVKTDDGFHASYSVNVTFMDEKKENVLFERIWKEKIKSSEFGQTLLRSNFNLSYKTFDLSPGNYFIKCFVEDSDSHRGGTKEMPLTVRSISDSLDVSDLLLIAATVKDSTGSKIIPNVSTSVTNKDTTITFYYNIYSSKSRDVYAEYQLNDFKKETSFKQLDPHKVKAGINPVTFTMNKLNFAFGDYSLRIVLKDNDWKEISSTEKKFNSRIQGLPASINDLEKAITQLKYIAMPEEMDFIQNGKTYEEKLARFIAFWDKKKPNSKVDDNPIFNEYYRRIDYSNKHFKGFGEGWRSDMGMIYITFGPPSSVERHPLDPNTKPYEIWDYYEVNRSFTFVDETGFGNYRLINPDYSRWPGYRQ